MCLDKHTTGDGIISALQVLRALVESGTTLAKAAGALDALPAGPDQRPARKARATPMASPAVKRAVKEAEAELDGGGRVLLRPSGTEPVIRVMVEGRHGRRCSVGPMTSLRPCGVLDCVST